MDTQAFERLLSEAGCVDQAAFEDFMRNAAAHADDQPPKPPSLRDQAYALVPKAASEFFEILRSIRLSGSIQDPWIAKAQELREACPHIHRIVVAGRTGAGKSTLINAILDVLLQLSSSGKSYTRKSLDSGPVFILFLAMTSVKQMETEAAEVHTSQTKIEQQFDKKQTDKLFANDPTLTITVETLMAERYISSCLGETVEVCAKDAETLKLEARPKSFFTSAKANLNLLTQLKKYTNPDAGDPAIWYLIKSIQIHGNFEALSTGVTLVDLPGYGDANTTRLVILHP
ncbi:hypothetical protein HWV62_45488 [Athelia sp. TMB]|nr:hypothetical protein HWV62_45488 [Athelia sp. TMB]